MKTTNEARTILEKATTTERSAWERGVAERLCTPSELKRTRNGERNPNGRETWIECQARALCQAFYKLVRTLEL